MFAHEEPCEELVVECDGLFLLTTVSSPSEDCSCTQGRVCGESIESGSPSFGLDRLEEERCDAFACVSRVDEELVDFSCDKGPSGM